MDREGMVEITYCCATTVLLKRSTAIERLGCRGVSFKLPPILRNVRNTSILAIRRPTHLLPCLAVAVIVLLRAG